MRILGRFYRNESNRNPTVELGQMDVKKPTFSCGFIHVGIFGRYFPHYRLGVFNILNIMEDIDLHVHASLKSMEGFSLIKPSEASFTLLNTAVWQFRIPFLRKLITMMPYSIWCIIKGQYDVFVLSNRISEVSVWINLCLARILGRHVCLWGHGISNRSGYIKEKFQKIMMKLADSIILYSEAAKKTSIEQGIAPDKLFVAYNALDTDTSKAIKEKATPDRIQRFKIIHNLDNKKVILFIGRLLEYKQPGLFIDAVSYVVRTIPEALGIIIGEGPMRKKLQVRIKSQGLENNVQLKGALFDENQIAYYLMSSSVAVMPAAAGLIIQHAFDHGVPIVVGDNMKSHGPEIELVTNGETGIFCKDGDAREFADAICRLLTNEEERRRMSANCRKIIDNQYNIQTMAAGFLKAVRYAAIKRKYLFHKV